MPMILEQPEWLFSVKDLTKVSKNSPSSTGGRFNSNPVSEPDINQFLGAMNKYQADYGVFITNSRFTNKAREAAREGTPITLIDGNDLIRLVIKYELYITPVTTYVLDGFYTED